MMTREEIPGRPVRVTVRHSDGRVCPTVNTIWDGLHIVRDGERAYIADRSVVRDGGRLGVGMTFVVHKDRTPEEKAAWLDGIDRAVRNVLPGWRLKRPVKTREEQSS